MKVILGALALASLAACLILPVLFFDGRISDGVYKNWLSAASLAWFIFAIAYASRARSA